MPFAHLSPQDSSWVLLKASSYTVCLYDLEALLGIEWSFRHMVWNKMSFFSLNIDLYQS